MDGWHTVPLWLAGGLPGSQPLCQSGLYFPRALSHVSLVKFCETTFGLAPLNARDAAADGMRDCFDFTQAPLGPPTAP